MLSPPTAIKYVVVSWTIFYILAVLFGAPIFSDIIATAVLAAALTLVSVIPAVLLFDSEERALEVLILGGTSGATIKESILLSTSVFALLSAWASAAVHPLDWDRWWQRYPLPSLFGCFAGALLGLFIGISRAYFNKKLALKKSKKR
uniref:Phosphatidylinositol-glycan biosynthesis class F protein n=1 Tax=Caenorhabditis japonica TaxID=281687 RepID=A0A8R1HWQ7_CAEJA